MRKVNNWFIKVADKVSYFIGTPFNIMLWVIAVGAWFALFIIHPNDADKAQLLPLWFTSNAFNFPLNTVTTLAELYIGFLVAAAANRVQKSQDKQAKDLYDLMKKVEQLSEQLAQNQTQEIQELEVDTKILLQETKTQEIQSTV